MISRWARTWIGAVVHPMVEGLRRVGITPNQLSLASLLASLLTGLAMAFGNLTLGAVLFLFTGLLELARRRAGPRHPSGNSLWGFPQLDLRSPRRLWPRPRPGLAFPLHPWRPGGSPPHPGRAVRLGLWQPGPLARRAARHRSKTSGVLYPHGAHPGPIPGYPPRPRHPCPLDPCPRQQPIRPRAGLRRRPPSSQGFTLTSKKKWTRILPKRRISPIKIHSKRY